MRLFIAINVLAEIRCSLGSFVEELRVIAPQAKWVRAENLHLTLKFLGETDPAKLERVQTALSTIRTSQPVILDFRGFGFFPTLQRPQVFWAAMNSSANLQALALDIDRTLHAIGFPVEQRPFTAHLTLARFHPSGPLPNLLAAVKHHSSRSFGSLTAHEFHLIESKPKSTGAEYTTVKTFPFVAEN
jgi:2'-5' RNA ligase